MCHGTTKHGLRLKTVLEKVGKNLNQWYFKILILKGISALLVQAGF